MAIEPGGLGRPGEPAPAAPGADPSMEDILASIRRILNEDETTPAAPPVPSTAAVATPVARSPEPEPAEEPLDLTEDMLIDPPHLAPEPIAALSPPPAPPLPASLPPLPAAPAPEPPRAIALEGLVAPAVAAAASASVGELLRTVAQERSSAVSRGGPTIEDVVREELRPLLKAWLDAHLPGMVERLVRTEIERVVGRALS